MHLRECRLLQPCVQGLQLHSIESVCRRCCVLPVHDVVHHTGPMDLLRVATQRVLNLSQR